mmetsp:Transcript_46664/g.118112  ORF Transcript_46664/g.118112 Transcript_46664/m.118112 type:complete len:170 (-) Transcript_46664:185-694(-)
MPYGALGAALAGAYYAAGAAAGLGAGLQLLLHVALQQLFLPGLLARTPPSPAVPQDCQSGHRLTCHKQPADATLVDSRTHPSDAVDAQDIHVAAQCPAEQRGDCAPVRMDTPGLEGACQDPESAQPQPSNVTKPAPLSFRKANSQRVLRPINTNADNPEELFDSLWLGR